MSAAIEVDKVSGRTAKVSVDSECDMVSCLGQRLGTVSIKDALSLLSESVVYREASHCIKHVACPVPMAILKAIEVELGLALPTDVRVSFVVAGEC